MNDGNSICQRVKITDYLQSRGVELIKSGKRFKCRCPLPEHPDDNTPSFWIGDFPDGGQYFKCFGCGEGGNLFSLIRLVEGKSNKQIFKEFADKFGLKLGPYDPGMRIDPLPEDILERFCEQEAEAHSVIGYARRYVQDRDGCEDAINKVSRLYKKLDRLMEDGDTDGIHAVMEDMIQLMIETGGKR